MTCLVQVGHGLTMVILFKNVGTDHGQPWSTHCQDHGRPSGSAMFIPQRRMLMSAHQVFDHD